jgi:hypothetical protein
VRIAGLLALVPQAIDDARERKLCAREALHEMTATQPTRFLHGLEHGIHGREAAGEELL